MAGRARRLTEAVAQFNNVNLAFSAMQRYAWCTSYGCRSAARVRVSDCRRAGASVSDGISAHRSRAANIINAAHTWWHGIRGTSAIRVVRAEGRKISTATRRHESRSLHLPLIIIPPCRTMTRCSPPLDAGSSSNSRTHVRYFRQKMRPTRN